MALVEVENLTKIYGFPPKAVARILGYDPTMQVSSRRMVRAVDNLSVTVEEGEVFGLLGPNGSGKTTLVKLILDIIRPTLGSISIMGCRPGTKKVHKEIGYLPEQPYFYERMSAVELLQFYGRIYKIDHVTLQQRIRESIELVGLKGHERRNLRSYSKGMLQRIGLAQALISKPKIVFLDEPSTGLDPVGRKQVKEVISRLRDSGATVFFNTHILSDVEDVADRVAIIHRGQLIRIGKVSEMTESIDKIVVKLRTVEDRYLSLFEGMAESTEIINGKLVIRFTDQDDIPEAIRRLASAGADIFEVAHQRETLEDVFVREVTNNKQGTGAK
jgi:ABC-2 type transport system ATP-binding protein